MGKHFKRWETAALLALSVTLLAAAWAQREQAALSGQLIRLHVIAASDEQTEQAVKLRVRDAVLACLEPVMDGAAGPADARERLSGHLRQIAEAASAAAEGRQVTVTFGPARYPERVFEGGTLPAGRYESLRVILGAGEGHNWWGLLFPQLCLPAAQSGGQELELRETLRRDGVLIEEERPGVQLRFRLLECWGEMLEWLSDCGQKPVA